MEWLNLMLEYYIDLILILYILYFMWRAWGPFKPSVM